MVCAIAYRVFKPVLVKLLDFALGPEDEFGYVSTTAPRTPPPSVEIVVNVSDPSEVDGETIARHLRWENDAARGLR